MSEPRPIADVTIVIVAYNSADVLPRCLEALAAQTVAPACVLLVDNASTDGGCDALAETETFRILRPGANLGFAGGNNLAANLAKSTWLALLNPDAFPAPDWLERLLEAAARRPDAASFGSTQWMDDDPSRLDGAGDSFHAAGIAYRRLNGRHGPPPPEGEVFSPCAAAALYRRDLFLEAGGFDEDFFCYCEDVDLGFRLRLMGWSAVQATGAQVRHVGSSTSGRYSEFAIFHGVRNRAWTYVKNMPGPWLWLLLPYVLLGWTLHGLSLIRRGRGGTYLRALAAALKGLGPMLAKRRALQKLRKAPMGKLLKALTWSPLALIGRS